MIKRNKKYDDKSELTVDEAVDFLGGISKDALRNYAKKGLVSRQKFVRLCSVQKNLRQRYLYIKSDLVKLQQG